MWVFSADNEEVQTSVEDGFKHPRACPADEDAHHTAPNEEVGKKESGKRAKGGGEEQKLCVGNSAEEGVEEVVDGVDENEGEASRYEENGVIHGVARRSRREEESDEEARREGEDGNERQSEENRL